MGAALRGGDDIDVAAHRGLVPDAPAQRDVDVALALDLRHVAVPALIEHRDRFLETARSVNPPDVGHCGVRGEEPSVFGDSAVVLEHLLDRTGFARSARQPALVAEREAQPRHQERGLTGPRLQLLVGEPGVLGEDLAVRPVADAGSGDTPFRRPDDFEPRFVEERFELGGGRQDFAVLEPAGLAAAERHLVGLASAIHENVQPSGEGVDNAGADAVQAAGRCVGATAELAPGMELREDHFDSAESGLRFGVDGNAPAVVVDLHRAVGVKDDRDVLPETGERLVDGIVNDFPQAMHQSPGVRRPDVHAWPLTNGLESLKD